MLHGPQVRWIIAYVSSSWEPRVFGYQHFHDELTLSVVPKRSNADQRKAATSDMWHAKSLTLYSPKQVTERSGGFGHIFWRKEREWRMIFWSDEVTFLMGGRTIKQKVTRNLCERLCDTSIQHQLRRGGPTSVNAWEAIGYN